MDSVRGGPVVVVGQCYSQSVVTNSNLPNLSVEDIKAGL